MPDCDDALRRLADVLRMPETCRRRGCREAGGCQGGYGPPCYFEHRAFFAEAFGEHMHEYRQLWAAHRDTVRAALRR